MKSISGSSACSDYNAGNENDELLVASSGKSIERSVDNFLTDIKLLNIRKIKPQK